MFQCRKLVIAFIITQLKIVSRCQAFQEESSGRFEDETL
nr:MAG TPA: hypothetical protein [Caudoviricetes sp.]